MSLPYVTLHDEAFLRSMREVMSIQITTKLHSTSHEILAIPMPRAVWCEDAGRNFRHRDRPSVFPNVFEWRSLVAQGSTEAGSFSLMVSASTCDFHWHRRGLRSPGQVLSLHGIRDQQVQTRKRVLFDGDCSHHHKRYLGMMVAGRTLLNDLAAF